MFSQFDARISSLEETVEILKKQTDRISSLEETVAALIEQNNKILSLLDKKNIQASEEQNSRILFLEKTVASMRQENTKLSQRITSLETTKHNFVLVGFMKHGAPIYLDRDRTTNHNIYAALYDGNAQTFLVESLKQFTNIKEFDFANSSWSNDFCSPPVFRLHNAHGEQWPIHKVVQCDAEAHDKLRQIFAGSDIKIFCRKKLIN